MKKIILSACTMLIFGAVVSAQDQTGANVNPNEEKAPIPEAVEMLETAGQLVKYGYANENPLPLIQAVEIYQNYAAPSDKAIADGAKTSDVDNSEAQIGEKTGGKTYDIAAIVADAKKFADGDEHYLALINNLENGATRGATQNYAAHHDRVNAYSTDSYTIRFYGGERACVIVSGDGDTDLDLYIYDANGNLVASDTDRTDDCVCIWTPRWTGAFTIKIKNLGRVYNNYVMAVN